MVAMGKVDNVDFGMDEINIDIDEVDNDNVEVTGKSIAGCADHWLGASQERLPGQKRVTIFVVIFLGSW